LSQQELEGDDKKGEQDQKLTPAQHDLSTKIKGILQSKTIIQGFIAAL
jgi:hypothetical protein